jgi:hypothetical protein
VLSAGRVVLRRLTGLHSFSIRVSEPIDVVVVCRPGEVLCLFSSGFVTDQTWTLLAGCKDTLLWELVRAWV